ncbi:MAG: YicC family protein [Planctomycetales bacterium]|nr:YicC family protein [Planctomycetales bacterium]
MLCSMTGFGEARSNGDAISVHAEVRSVNNRHLKVNSRLQDGYGSLEPRCDALVRNKIRRGTIQLTLYVDHEISPDDLKINQTVLLSYHHQISEAASKVAMADDVRMDSSILLLPGVVDEGARKAPDLDEEWPLIEKVVNEALDNLTAMRQEEGAAMAKDMRSNRTLISDQLAEIEKRAPVVVESYQRRLLERLNHLLQKHDLNVDASDVIKEVGIFAERADISEEIVRLQSHLEQFDSILDSKEGAGRKLDFLIQEMFRETNTIGSKANDAEIARHVVEIKSTIERLREMVQNIE